MTVRIITGDCRKMLNTLTSESVNCCVTSPPYFGLRDYGTGAWDGGAEDCSHRPDDTPQARGIDGSTLGGGKNHTGHKQEGFKSICGKCGARRVDDQIGLEDTPEGFVLQLVSVMAEVRRVLRNDGTLWLNLGDSYSSGGRTTTTPQTLRGDTGAKETNVRPKNFAGIKPKDLLGIPWRVALALQADGWYLRQDIIWHKPNPMPESVTDRCTKAHEYIFLLSKSPHYYYDADAIAEPTVNKNMPGTNMTDTRETYGEQNGGNSGLRDFKKKYKEGEWPTDRNRRSVWTVPTQAFKGSHFATFPPDLIEPCILAGCPKGGTVLDPFGGAGTTGLVSDRLGRDAVLIELNPEYAAMADRRMKQDGGMFYNLEAQ